MYRRFLMVALVGVMAVGMISCSKQEEPVVEEQVMPMDTVGVDTTMADTAAVDTMVAPQ